MSGIYYLYFKLWIQVNISSCPNDWEYDKNRHICSNEFICSVIRLPNTVVYIELVQKFINETREKISNGVDITFRAKINSELEELMLAYDIIVGDIFKIRF